MSPLAMATVTGRQVDHVDFVPLDAVYSQIVGEEDLAGRTDDRGDLISLQIGGRLMFDTASTARLRSSTTPAQPRRHPQPPRFLPTVGRRLARNRPSPSTSPALHRCPY